MPRYKAPVVPKEPDYSGNGKSYSPEVKGRKKSGMLDWSIDELIEYKNNGTPPARIPDAEILYKLGKAGISMANAADIFNISKEKFSSNADWLENWQRGRAECGARVRASIVEDALDKDILMAKIYVDKILGGDTIKEGNIVQVNVNTGNLTNVSTDELLEVAFRDGTENNQDE